VIDRWLIGAATPGARPSLFGSRAALAVVALVIAVACSAGDDADATATPENIATPTAQVVAATFTPTPTHTPTPTPVVAPSPTATQPTARPTPTPVRLPEDGGELTIFGRAVTQIVAADADGAVLYAVSGSRIARSPDGGVSWFAQGRAPAGRIVPALNDPDRLYAGDLGSCAMSVRVYPLTVSTDGGREWEEVAEAEGYMPLLVEAGTPDVLVGTTCTLQVSLDGGASWQFVPTTSNFDVRTAASRERSLAGEIAVIGTSEGGTSILWVFDLSAPGAIVERGEVLRFWGGAGLAWSGGRIVVATSTGVGVSDDDGATWRWSRAGLENVTFSVDPLTEPIPPDEQGRTTAFNLAAIDPADRDRIWVAGAPGVFHSDDGGATWARLGDIENVTSLAVSAASGHIFVVADGRAYVWATGSR
jgi:photosystem II stability/assembly factor-like uncharacterized protein